MKYFENGHLSAFFFQYVYCGLTQLRYKAYTNTHLRVRKDVTYFFF